MASLHIARFVDVNYIFNIGAGVGKGRPNKYLDVLLVQYLLFCATNKAASVLILKSASYYVFSPIVRRQKRWMLARISLAVLVQRKGFGSALVASM